MKKLNYYKIKKQIINRIGRYYCGYAGVQKIDYKNKFFIIKSYNLYEGCISGHDYFKYSFNYDENFKIIFDISEKILVDSFSDDVLIQTLRGQL